MLLGYVPPINDASVPYRRGAAQSSACRDVLSPVVHEPWSAVWASMLGSITANVFAPVYVVFTVATQGDVFYAHVKRQFPSLLINADECL